MRSNVQKFNDCTDILKTTYGLDEVSMYDVIIIAPSWKPEKIFIISMTYLLFCSPLFM